MSAEEKKKVAASAAAESKAPAPEPELPPHLQEQEEDDYDDFIERDFSKWINNRRLADVVFVVGKNRELFWGHRALLAAGSDVFASMVYPNHAFGSPATPAPVNASLTGVAGIPAGMLAIEIRDTEPDMFKILVSCIYTNHADIEIEHVGECMRLSQKYCIDKLAGLCGVFLDKGISIDNAIQMYETAPKLLGDPDFGFDFICENAKEIFELPEFVTLSKPRLINLVRASELKIKETDLFKAVVAWGKAECKRLEKKTDAKEDLKAALAEVLPHIRFPLMTVAEFSSTVSPLQILSPEDILKLFTYIAQKDAKPPPKTLPSTPYSDEPRALGSGGFDFNWARCGTRGTVSGGITFYSTSSGYCSVLGDKSMKPNTGTYYWEVKVDNMHGGDWQMGVGVATASLNLENYLSANHTGWGYFGQGCRARATGSSSDRYGETYTTGDSIGVLYDSVKGTLSFYKNKRPLGQAFAGIREEVWPAAQLNTSGRMTLIKGARQPA